MLALITSGSTTQVEVAVIEVELLQKAFREALPRCFGAGAEQARIPHSPTPLQVAGRVKLRACPVRGRGRCADGGRICGWGPAQAAGGPCPDALLTEVAVGETVILLALPHRLH